MLEPKRHIGEALKRQRVRLGLTQAELAKRMGKTQTYVARVESGKRDPRWATVLEFARALELEPMLVPRTRVPGVEVFLHAETDLPGDVPPLVGGAW